MSESYVEIDRMRLVAERLRTKWRMVSQKGLPKYQVRNRAADFALADWLDFVANTHEEDPTDYCRGGGHADFVLGDPGPVHPCTSWWCQNMDQALKFTNAFLMETT